MTWKTVPDGDSGDATHFGGNDTNKFSKLFSGQDVDDVDMNADWTFRSGKLHLRNPGNTFGYNVITSAIITSDKDITVPLLTSNANFVFDSFANTFSAAQKMDNYIDLKAISEPSAPASGYIRLFIDSGDGKTKIKRSNGDVVIVE